MDERWPVQTVDGHEFELLAFVPDRPRAALLFGCALGVDASYYAPFGESLKARGVLVALCDLRGNGTSNLQASRAVDFGYREIVEVDLPAAFEVFAERTPDVPRYLGGHSLGGQLVLLHVATKRPDIEGVVLVACAIPYFRSWKGRRRLFVRLASILFPIVGSVLGYVPGKRFGFGGEREARTLMRDWSHNAATARYEPIGSHVDYEDALVGLVVEFVTVNVAGDSMGPPNAVELMFEKLPSAIGTRIEAELSERGPGAHFRWARDPSAVSAAIDGWLSQRE